MLNLKKKYVPNIPVKTDSNNPWFNKQLKSLLNRKKRLYKRANATGHSEAWHRYQLCSKQYIQELRKAKPKFFSTDLLNILQTNPNKFWRMISNKPGSNLIELKDQGNEPINSDKCADVLNDYFCSIFFP